MDRKEMRGHSIQKWWIKNRGAGKIESRRVLAGRGRNTLQGRTASKEPNVEHTRACDSIGTQQERDGIDLLSCVGPRVLGCLEAVSENVDGNERNAPEPHGTSNGTHGDVRYVDMCVLNPALRNPGRKWGGAGLTIVLKESAIISKASAGIRTSNKASNRGVAMEEWKIGHTSLRFYVMPASPPHAEPRTPGDEDQTQSRGRLAWVPPTRKKQNRGRPWGLGKRSRQADDSIWGKLVVGVPWPQQRGKNRFRIAVIKLRIVVGMSSLVHHEFGERRLRYGPKGTRAYARKPYCDAWGNMVPALFPDEEEMGTFQFAPEVEMTPPKRGRGRPRKSGLTGEGLGPFTMEDSVPTRKRGRPRKIPSIDADRLRSITGICQCGTLMQAKQGPRSVWEYTEEFQETAKRCKPKSGEDWCRWYKAGLREEIQDELIDVLEPWKLFSLVNRMAGQAMEAERGSFGRLSVRRGAGVADWEGP
ncbi:hypothetical protein F2Q68_00009591 [Brassica cretica]|uniref:Uncharacterized protein n=1 Tax=Brassica cretica TaxID=69181 RepID=A0A8S9L2J3_BRACR|nr:hypothetical protein F2Q68_00009591 [Brassica cretica]